MNKFRRMYTKALIKYEKGYIDDAIDICNKIISLDMKNRAAINLKGLLIYFKGDLKEASTLWRLNSEINKDEVARKYLESIDLDEDKLSKFIYANKLIKDIKIKNAIEVLKDCEESDYNFLNVYNAIADCYIKMGKYKIAVDYINKILKVDKNNKKAILNKKKLIECGIDKKQFIICNSYKKTKIVSLIGVFLIGLSFIYVNKFKDVKVFKNFKGNIYKSVNIVDNSNNKKEKHIKTIKKIKVNTLEKEIFPYKDIENAINIKDFNKLDYYMCKFKNKKLNINNKNIILRGEELLKKEGSEYFYNQGVNNYNKINCLNDAINNLKKAYTYGSEEYFYDDTIFFMGVSYQIKKDIENAIRYFQEYDNKFQNEDYECEVLYRLSILYKNIDLNKAKEYSKKLIERYPNSEYCNSIIKAIINI